MGKNFCIWGKPEGQAKYDQLIADGWKPLISGELTTVFVKEPVAIEVPDVHTTPEKQ